MGCCGFWGCGGVLRGCVYGAGTIKAEQVCWFVFPGVHTDSPFEEGPCVDRPVATHWVWGEGASSKNARGGDPTHDATVTMSPFWNCPARWHHNFNGLC